MTCSRCGQTAAQHACPAAPTLADHFTASAFYDACPGDRAVWHALYPEAIVKARTVA